MTDTQKDEIVRLCKEFSVQLIGQVDPESKEIVLMLSDFLAGKGYLNRLIESPNPRFVWEQPIFTIIIDGWKLKPTPENFVQPNYTKWEWEKISING